MPALQPLLSRYSACHATSPQQVHCIHSISLCIPVWPSVPQTLVQRLTVILAQDWHRVADAVHLVVMFTVSGHKASTGMWLTQRNTTPSVLLNISAMQALLLLQLLHTAAERQTFYAARNYLRLQTAQSASIAVNVCMQITW